MGRLFKLLVLFLSLSFCHVSFSSSEEDENMHHKKTYIVHMAKSDMPKSFNHHLHWYESSLKSASKTAEIIYTYENALHGYSARLTPHEAESLASQPGIISVSPELRYQLHTTRTPSFLGLEPTSAMFTEPDSAMDIIIGVLDTGVWPESKSFDDTGMGPIPSSWKGSCEPGTNFTESNCNRKLIGARFFCKGYEAARGPVDVEVESRSPRDDDGHGTHTASTAAGSAVHGASLFGYAAGTARGMAAKARVAAYKVCWNDGCYSSDILAGMDKAIEDNVDVMSLSLGGDPMEYYWDEMAIGGFAAMEKGIVVSCSAGNSGPRGSTLSNVAPWIMTVGAGTLDRDFPDVVVLGNGKDYSGASVYSGDLLPSSLLPLVYAGNVSLENMTEGNLCMPESLDPEKVKGKLVLCDRGEYARAKKGLEVKVAGGAGMILANMAEDGEELVADSHLLPATMVGERNANAIKRYVFSDPNPIATIIFKGTKVGIQPSPVVAAFSSRGPNMLTPSILKPDLIAPGLNILAAWSGSNGPTGLPEDPRRVEFNIISGTSMSCPHVSGLAGLLKAAHPDWSPAAIKSALMTTAYVTYKNGKQLEDVATERPSTAFAHGAGHVQPMSALDPGLVYDLTVDDYLSFLCALNYTPAQINMVARRKLTCQPKKYSLEDFNYPSFAVPFQSTKKGDHDDGSSGGGFTVVKYTRVLTNVGTPGTYKVTIKSQAPEVKIAVEPQVLSFAKQGEKKSYTVTLSAGSMPSSTTKFARIEWSDGKHVVGSPIAFSWT